jgi:hypothetical protein
MPRSLDDSSSDLESPATTGADTKYWILLSCAVFLVTVAFAVLGLAYYKIFHARSSNNNNEAATQPSQPGGARAGAGARQMPTEILQYVVNKVKRNDIELGHGEEYTSIAEALDEAPPGVILRIRDQEIYEEQLVHGRRTPHSRVNLQIVAEKSADGKTATLRLPRDAAPGTPLVLLDRADGLEIHGLILDGDNRCDDIVVLRGDCHSAVLDDLDIRGFRRSAVRLENCNSTLEASERKPVLVRDLRVQIPEKGDAASLAALTFSGMNSEINVLRNRFMGPCSALVRIEGTLTSSTFDSNLFFGGQKTALQFGKEPGDGFALDLQLRSNTFAGFQNVCLFRQNPASKGVLNVNSNLFYQVSQGICAVDAPASAEKIGEIVQGEGNVRDAKSPLGQWQHLDRLKIVEMPFQLSTGGDQPTKLLRYSVKSPLATAGQEGCFVGAFRPWLE